MKIDFRILTVVTCFLLLGASAVVIVRNVSKISSSSVVLETIPVKGVPSSGRVAEGLSLSINAEGLSLSLPDCDATAWQDQFFVHLYTDGVRNRSPEDFANMDFNLKDEATKVTTRKTGESCLIVKSFSNFKVRAAGIGQYNIPNGKCCDIIWSRFYVFDTGSAQK